MEKTLYRVCHTNVAENITVFTSFPLYSIITEIYESYNLCRNTKRLELLHTNYKSL